MELETLAVEVTGTLIHFNRGAAFFQFQAECGPATCLFRPNRLLVNGRRPTAGQLKTLEAIREFLAVGDVVTGLVLPRTGARPYEVTTDSQEKLTIEPAWYAEIVWKGEKPDCLLQEANSANEMSPKIDQEVVLDNVPGKIILNQLATGTGRGAAGQTIISFCNPEGKPDLAMFRNPKFFYMEGERIQPKVYKKWAKNYEMDVFFSAIYTPGLKELVTKAGYSSTSQEGMEDEVKLKPNWRARLVWIGPRPSEDKIKVDEESTIEDKLKIIKEETDDVLTVINGLECIEGQLLKFTADGYGLLSAGKSRNILFSSEKLTIDGQQLKAEDSLESVLTVGEKLFCYARPADWPLKIEGSNVTDQAVQVWKGRQAEAREENIGPPTPRKKKATFPLPSDATHLGLEGTVVDLVTPGIGYLEIDEGRKASGERVLFSRNRFYINGNRLRHKENLANHLRIGSKVCFDMVRGTDIKLEQGENYAWIAVLAWVGSEPSRTDINEEISRKVEHHRAKVITLDDWSKEAGCTGGILQVTGGPGYMGERVVFSRENTHVFGVRLNRADLSYVLRIGDKVQIELQCLQQPVLRCGAEIKYCAALVYIGPPPKAEEGQVEDPTTLLSGSLAPFLYKRGITEEEFMSLGRGQLPPKPLPSASVKPDIVADVLPPVTVYGKVIELRKPENPASGTEHGLFQIENGPAQHERAFFNRNCLFCWGYNCSKADLMYLITENDRFCVEIKDGTNNKAVQFKVTSAWIGPHPSDRNRKAGAMVGNPIFMKWLRDHSLSMELFLSVVEGRAPALPYFPILAAEQQLPARLAYFLPARFSGRGGGAEAGVLRLCQTHPNSKDGRRAPEVLFERDSLYIWNVPITNGDLRYVINETDKVFVEVTDLLGKEKKKWQSRLGTLNIPKFIATLVYIGGGRPKQEKISVRVADNHNLAPWLKKRGMDVSMFESLLNGELMPKGVDSDTGEDVFSQAYPAGESSPFSNPAKAFGVGVPSFAQRPMANSTAVGMGPSGGAQSSAANSFQASVLNKAVRLTQKTMSLQSPEDPEVRLLIQDDSEAQLALFLSKTLTNAVMMYRQMPGSIWPPSNPGPIGPPRRGGGRIQGGGGDFNEFYADSCLLRGGPDFRGGGSGLYGLSQPLLDYNNGGSAFGGYHGNMEPPYKRKYEDW